MDDKIGLEITEFEEQSKVTERTFESKPRKFDSFIFAGISIEKRQTDYFLHQTNDAFNLKQLTSDCTFEEFRARRYELEWLN